MITQKEIERIRDELEAVYKDADRPLAVRREALGANIALAKLLIAVLNEQWLEEQRGKV